MLLFISMFAFSHEKQSNFNTSHVTVYRHCFTYTVWCKEYFNTSHVTVYPEVKAISGATGRFQYISCYCLSALPSVPYFVLSKFQYISCYCLSAGSFVNAVACIFQYISCYCLSNFPLLLPLFAIAFQYISCYCLSCL